MHAVILAAGRGSRLGPRTDDRPKGLVEVAGRPMLDWQARALRAGGMEEVTVITGYRGGDIAARGFATLENPDWNRGNMVSSLARALAAIPGPLIVSYSDILYSAATVRALAARDAPLVLSHDPDWLTLWERRFDDPLSDAETFRLGARGQVTEIGGRTTDASAIQGQFMGLVKIGTEGRGWIEALLAAQPKARLELDTTSLLSTLISAGHPVTAIPVQGAWCEVDGPRDLAVAEALVAEGRLTPEGAP